MESKEKKILFLSNLFQHLDGIVLIPVIAELQKNNILNDIYTQKKCSLSYLSQKYNANEGYLNVSLRLLCSQGIIKQKKNNDDIVFEDNVLEEWLALDIISKYNITMPLYTNKIDYDEIIYNNQKQNISNSILFQTTQNYVNQKHHQNLIIQKNSPLHTLCFNYNKHIEGAMIGPIIVLLSKAKKIHKLNTGDKLNIEIQKKWKQIIYKLFQYVKITDENDTITEYGSFILKRATSYGVTVSYLPTFQSINKLLYGLGNELWNNQEKEEKHVDRSMNVWGSGGAHHTYFKKVDKIIIDLFNLPIEQQPKGFIDIGCGNGKLIEHIFDLIYYHTLRGKHLKKYPLFIVGSDFNYKALEATNETIQKADIWAKTAFGDISEPDDLAKRLMKNHNIKLNDLLNVRSFLDHNRIYTSPVEKHTLKSSSTGAFCYRGKRLYNRDIEQNLIEHFTKWAPYVKKYGLLIVELHTIDPLKSAQNIGKTAITAYDASHGFSDQYIIEYNLFLKAALKANLKPDPEHEYTFPSSEIPIVSINRLI